jgi:hypothetical protein
MNNRKLNLLAVILGVVVAATIYAAFVQGGKAKQQPQKPQITSLPKIKSCLRALTVQSAFFREPDPNSDSMELVLQLMNNSDASIVAVSIEWTSKKEHTEGSLVINSFGADTPKILVMPHSLYEVAIPVGNFSPDASVQVGSVVFADGTEDGCTNSLKALHELKSREEKKSDKSKAPQK